METMQVTPDQILPLLSGYWVTQVVATSARLKVLDELPATSAEVARGLGLPPDPVHRLLRGCAAVGVARLEGDRFLLTPIGKMLTWKHPQSMAPLAAMLADPAHWLPWGKLEGCVRTGKMGVYEALGVENPFHYFEARPEEGERFNHAMASMSRMWAAQLPELYDFTPYQTIVDIGGSHGIVLSAALRQNPKARGVLFDLPHVVALADDELKRQGTLDRIEKVGGNFFECVPAGDVYLLKHILHDWNDDQCRAILGCIRKAMPQHGRVLVLEMVLQPQPGPVDLMDLNMLVMTGGRERSVAQYEELFASAGMRLLRAIPTPGTYMILEAGV